jgi:hypothetical protein
MDPIFFPQPQIVQVPPPQARTSPSSLSRLMKFLNLMLLISMVVVMVAILMRTVKPTYSYVF